MKPRSYDVLLLVAGFLVCWQILYWLVGADVVSSPSSTILRAIALLQTRNFWNDADKHRRRVCLCLRHWGCRRHGPGAAARA